MEQGQRNGQSRRYCWTNVLLVLVLAFYEQVIENETI
jgi:hypothetical protein